MANSRDRSEAIAQLNRSAENLTVTKTDAQPLYASIKRASNEARSAREVD